MKAEATLLGLPRSVSATVALAALMALGLTWTLTGLAASAVVMSDRDRLTAGGVRNVPRNSMVASGCSGDRGPTTPLSPGKQGEEFPNMGSRAEMWSNVDFYMGISTWMKELF